MQNILSMASTKQQVVNLTDISNLWMTATPDP